MTDTDEVEVLARRLENSIPDINLANVRGMHEDAAALLRRLYKRWHDAEADVAALKLNLHEDRAGLSAELTAARAEIERLTRRLSLADTCIDGFEADRINFKAEIKRLRAALDRANDPDRRCADTAGA